MNRYLLEGMAQAGNGLSVYATTREDPSEGVDRFFRYIDRAVLTDLNVSWGELGSFEIYPHPAPDLFASHPVILHGRYKTKSDLPILITARRGEEKVQLPVKVRQTLASGDRGGIIGALWARSKVEHLESEAWVGMRPDAPAEITKLGLAYDLVTPYTSFVAVDASRRVGDGRPDHVVQPVEVPEGVDGTASGARTAAPNTLSQAPVARPQPGQAAPPAPGADEKGYEYELQDDPASAGMVPIMPREQASEEEALWTDADDAAPSTPPGVERDARGCYCAAASGGGDRRGLWIALAGIGLVAWRRRGRVSRRRRRPGAERAPSRSAPDDRNLPSPRG